MRAAKLAAATAATLALSAGARAEPPVVTPAPVAAASLAVDDGEGEAMLARLAGQRARLADGRLVIDDVAGEGRPWVGVIERRGGEPWLVTGGGAVRLVGPLARPRIAGPGYRAWATGVVEGAVLRVRRLGILARPRSM